jgi:hypothetical protein
MAVLMLYSRLKRFDEDQADRDSDNNIALETFGSPLWLGNST